MLFFLVWFLCDIAAIFPRAAGRIFDIFGRFPQFLFFEKLFLHPLPLIFPRLKHGKTPQ